MEMDNASVSRLQGDGGSGQDPLSAPGHGCPLCQAGKPSQALISLPWPRPSHEAPAGRVLLQRVQQRCLMPSASQSPVAPSASALGNGGTDAQLQVRVSSSLASPSWGAPRWHRLGGGSLSSSPFGMLFNSTSASCILASWHAACFYFSWICLDDEAC